MIARAGLLLAVVAAFLPWTTAWRLYGADERAALVLVPQLLFGVAAYLAIALHVGAVDGWLGGFVAWVTVRALWTPLDAQPLLVAQHVALGAFFVVAWRDVPSVWRSRLVRGVLVVALLQVAYAALQRFAQWDPLWPHGEHVRAGLGLGTFASSNELGSYLALVALLAPVGHARWWGFLPLLAGVVIARHSIGLAAIGASYLVRDRYVFGRWRYLLVAVVVPVSIGTAVYARPLSLMARFEGWWSGLTLWALNAPWTGLGPGSWALVMPQLRPVRPVFVGEDQTKFFGPHAHNELVQVAFELGLVGLVLVGGWLWTHRAALLASPACVALGVLTLGVFPFHTAGVAMAALLVIAEALADERRRPRPVLFNFMGTSRWLPSLCLDGHGVYVRVHELRFGPNAWHPRAWRLTWWGRPLRERSK